MAREFQSLMMKNLEIIVSGTRIHRLALNRHMPRVENVEVHHHAFEQLLLYLRGSGFQFVDGRKIPVRRGSLIFLQKEQNHGFEKIKNVSPLCLAIDLDLEASVNWPLEWSVSSDSLQIIERSLYELSKSNQQDLALDVAAGVLRVASALAMELNQNAKLRTGPKTKLVSSWIADADMKELTPKSVSMKLGKSIDYLNRELKSESHTSVGRLIASARFEAAGRLLKESQESIGDIALRIGFIDQNYFARWFRKECGLTPTQWRKRG